MDQSVSDVAPASSDAEPGGEGPLPAEAERRLVLRVLNHWREAKGEKRLPTLADLNIEAAPELWESSCLVVIDRERGFVIERVGETFLGYAPFDLPGRALDELPSDSMVAHFTSFAAEVADREVPVTRGGVLPSEEAPSTLYRSIILPVTKSTGELKWLLVAANWREVVAA